MSTALKGVKGSPCFVPSAGLKIVRNISFAARAECEWKGGKWSEEAANPEAHSAQSAAM